MSNQTLQLETAKRCLPPGWRRVTLGYVFELSYGESSPACLHLPLAAVGRRDPEHGARNGGAACVYAFIRRRWPAGTWSGKTGHTRLCGALPKGWSQTRLGA